MDTAQLNQIINSILSTIPNANPSDKQNDDGTDSIQYLLPVDLLVSVTKKTNEKKIEAAIPSSFAIYPQPVIIASANPSAPSTPQIPEYSMKTPVCFSQQKQQQPSSALNPSAASFTPSHPQNNEKQKSMDPIPEYPNEGSAECTDPWSELDTASAQSPTPRAHPNAPSNAPMPSAFK